MIYATRGGALKSVEAELRNIFPVICRVLDRRAIDVEDLAAQVDPQSEQDPLALGIAAALAREHLTRNTLPIRLGELALLAGMNRAALTYRSRLGDLEVSLVRRSGATRGPRVAGDGYVVSCDEARRFLASLDIPGFA